MPGTLYDANNVAVGHAALYTRPWVLGTPYTKMPDSTALFAVTAWETAGWAVAGATHEGFKINAEASTTTITIEEQSTPVEEQLEAKSVSIEAALAEDTINSMSMAWGGGTVVSVAAGASQPGKQTMSLDNQVKKVVACLELKNPKGFARRIYIAKASLFGSGETSFRRSAEKRTYPIKLNSLCRPDEIEVVEIIAAATA